MSKPASLVEPSEALGVAGEPSRFVSRGGHKLAAALDRFGIDPRMRDCLDAGASTGGFTDCLLQAGAARVAAVDVGYGQLAWSLRTDPRVLVIERTNVRDLTPGTLPFVPSLIVADLSFISLRLVLGALGSVATENAELILLVKPQFEAGPADVRKGGVVRDPHVWRRVIGDVASSLVEHGGTPAEVMASPVIGPAGNVEFLLHGEMGRSHSRRLEIEPAIAEGERMRA